MSEFKPGQAVRIPCSIAPGAFPGENLITVENELDSISGFVRQEFIRDGYVLGTILAVEPDRVLVKIPGSFFTSALGTTSLSSSWATSHLVPAVA